MGEIRHLLIVLRDGTKFGIHEDPEKVVQAITDGHLMLFGEADGAPFIVRPEDVEAVLTDAD